MIQYDDFGTIPQAVKDLVANKISLLDQYMLIQTGQYEYTAQIRNTSTQKVQQIRIYRESYNSSWEVEIREGSWDWVILNEYYCCSNVGYGSSLDLPVMEGVTAHATVIMCCALMFAIIFKGVLFPCLLGRKRKNF